MKKFLFLLFAISTTLSFYSCGSTKYLPVSISSKKSFSSYKYVYVDRINSSGSFYSSGCDILQSLLMKKGFLVLSLSDYYALSSSQTYSTMKVTVAVGGTRNIGIWGDRTTEVTLQFVSAATNDIVCVCTGEGYGGTSFQSDDVEVAVTRCINSLFP